MSLEKEIERIRGLAKQITEREALDNDHGCLEPVVFALLEALAIQGAALDFYADKTNWGEVTEDFENDESWEVQSKIEFDDVEWVKEDGEVIEAVAGKSARQSLATSIHKLKEIR